MLDITKKLQTRDGRNVLIKFTDGRSKTHPIVGYIEDETSFSFWTLAGIWAGHASPENDLINTPEWRLPDPPHGHDWHRYDWTEGMLPDGWRPLLLGERPSCGDQLFTDDRWIIVNLYTPAKGYEPHQRTQRPLPSPKPKLREVPLCADDIKAGDEFLSPEGNRYKWNCIVSGCVVFHNKSSSLSRLMDEGWKIRSIGETEWRKCSRTEEVPA